MSCQTTQFPINNPCASYPNAKCVVYTGINLSPSNIFTNDRLDVIIVKLNTAIRNAASGFAAPIKGVAGRGQVQDPIVGTTSYQNDALISLGGPNGELDAMINGALWQNYGNNGNQFNFDPATGIISGLNAWYTGDSISIDLNQ